MRLAGLACLLVFAVCTAALASDLYEQINRARTEEGNCAVAHALPPLLPRAALEQVARELARGGNLDDSLDRAGYRSTRASAISIKGDGLGEQPAALLAGRRFCPQLTDIGLTEVGLYRDARSVWIVLAAPSVPQVALSQGSAGRRVLDLVNVARATPRSCGERSFKAARPVRWNDSLATASRLHSEDMARYSYFSHSGRDGSEPAQRVERAGYQFSATAENIAAGPTKPEDAVAAWLDSPPHCANLMDPAYTEMGAAFARTASGDTLYWTQAFGRPR